MQKQQFNFKIDCPGLTYSEQIKCSHSFCHPDFSKHFLKIDLCYIPLEFLSLFPFGVNNYTNILGTSKLPSN